MVDFIVTVVILVIVGLAITYIVKAKKSGVKCIGCPVAGQCAGKSKSGCSCDCGGSGENADSKSDCGCNADIEA